jgi:hypothetical protein
LGRSSRACPLGTKTLEGGVPRHKHKPGSHTPLGLGNTGRFLPQSQKNLLQDALGISPRGQNPYEQPHQPGGELLVQALERFNITVCYPAQKLLRP